MSAVRSTCQAMIDVCHTRIYHDNMFHLTGLPVDATSRDIARRQDDLRAAEVSGDWQGEFRHIMSSREIPDPQIIREKFVLLQNDPERRLVEEFFWFWPLELGKGKTDPALLHIRTGSRDKAFGYWTGKLYVEGLVGLAAQHNLAVLHHLYAIDYEFALQNGNKLTPEQLQTMAHYWKAAINYWEPLADDDDFWGIVTDRVRSIDDPRLTTGFVRRMRGEFPVSFDRINAQLAVTYAGKGRYSDARRHVAIMKETHQGLDDVDHTIGEILKPMEKRIELIVGHAMGDLQQKPETGLQHAKNILNMSKEPLEVVKGFFDDGHAVRTVLFDAIAGAGFSCLIAYGNKTEDWEPCVKLLEKVDQLAVTPEFKKRIQENIRIVKENAESKRLHDYCWFCKTNMAVPGREFECKMYGEVMSEFDQINLARWKATSRAKQNWDGTGVFMRLADADNDPFLDKQKLKGTCVWKGLPAKVPCCNSCLSLDFSSRREKCKEYPLIKELLNKGWKFGEKPSEAEQRVALGLPAVPASSSSNSGCCVVFFAGMTIPLLGWLLKSGVTMLF